MSQQLWATGAASAAKDTQQPHDDDMIGSDHSSHIDEGQQDSHFSIDEETREKCLDAKEKAGNGLYGLSLSTYQASVLNSKLSGMKLRLELTETVVT